MLQATNSTLGRSLWFPPNVIGAWRAWPATRATPLTSQADLDAYRSSELFEQQVQAPLSDNFVDEFRTYHCEVDIVEDVG